MIGYIRVSTLDQSLDLQRDALLAAGITEDCVYQDACSGRAVERPGLARALDVARGEFRPLRDPRAVGPDDP